MNEGERLTNYYAGTTYQLLPERRTTCLTPLKKSRPVFVFSFCVLAGILKRDVILQLRGVLVYFGQLSEPRELEELKERAPVLCSKKNTAEAESLWFLTAKFCPFCNKCRTERQKYNSEKSFRGQTAGEVQAALT